MRRLLRFLVVIPVAYIAACLSGGLFITAAIYDFRSLIFLTSSEGRGFALTGMAFAAAVLAIPTLVAIILAELRGLRSPVFWAAYGGGLGLIATVLAAAFGMNLPAFIVGGAIGGLVFWAMAGRKAGTLRPTA